MIRDEAQEALDSLVEKGLVKVTLANGFEPTYMLSDLGWSVAMELEAPHSQDTPPNTADEWTAEDEERLQEFLNSLDDDWV